MKTLRAAYQAALDSGVTTLCYCVRIERTDGVVHRFTSHSRALTMLDTGAVYVPDQGGADVTAVRHSSDLDADNFDLQGPLLASGIAREDIAAGRFDYAAIYLFRTLWDDPHEDDEKLAKGFWGAAELRRHRYVTEFRSLASLLDQRVGRVQQAPCDADLGDARCQVDLNALEVSGTITAVTDRRTFTDSGRGEADNYFGAGTITFTSGANAGLSKEIDSFGGGQFALWEAMPFTVAVGDGYTAQPGCRKRLEADCRDKFSNVVNFQGFPHIPGAGAVTKFGGQ